MKRTLARFVLCFVWMLKIFAWLAFFCMTLFTYHAVKDLFRASVKPPRQPDVYPTEDVTASVLDLPQACWNITSYDAIMVVHSAVGHFSRRQNYRDTYGNFIFTEPYKIKVVFFLGLPVDPDVQIAVTRENILHQDTVQAAFVDSYHNLSLKAVSVLRWLTEKCKEPNLVIKIDDDVLLDVDRFFEEFSPPAPYYNDVLIHCHSWEAAEAERTGKWRLTRKQFSLDLFPDYCSGFFVLMHMTAVEELYYTSLVTPILWVDDVYIYGIVREKTQDIQVLYLDHVSYSEKIYNDCVRQYGYRCKFWATVLDLSPESHLVPALLSLKADRLKHQMTTEASTAVTQKGERGWSGDGQMYSTRARRCAPGTCRLRRRREMERRGFGGNTLHVEL